MTNHGPNTGEHAMFLDGTGITPGTEKCKCGQDCEFPCWQRLGWAPACEQCGCPDFPERKERPDA